MSSGQRRCPQQRLFTGALFTETLNAELHAFALRHHLRSHVWVPRKAIDTALKPYGVFVLPRAALCDVTIASGGGMGDITASIGTDRVLVNAEQTSHQQLLEHFREFMVAKLLPPPPAPTGIDPHVLERQPPAARTVLQAAPPQRSEYFSAAVGSDEAQEPVQAAPILLPEPSWDTAPPFQYPLALNGSPFLGTDAARRLASWQAEGRYWSVYWRRARSRLPSAERFAHVVTTGFPGRYNPHFCVRYTPHTYTNLSFPALTAQLMRYRAVEHRYVSRLWMTLRQAEELFGAHLLPERAHDGPVVFCRYFTAGMEATAYYCADQFDDAAGAFPCAQEIALATRGVWVASGKMRAYPLLARLQRCYAVSETADKAAGDRAGIDLAMADARRHGEFNAYLERCSAIELHGFWSESAQKAYLTETNLRKTLTRQCLLCNYARPLFFSNRTLLSHNLTLRDGEQGILQTRVPVHLPEKLAWTKGECWFNVSQLEDAVAATELHDHPPRHFLTRQLLHGSTALQCCRMQVARRRGRSNGGTAALPPPQQQQQPNQVDNEWVPVFVLDMTGWRLRNGARGIPYVPLATGAAYKRFPLGRNILFQVADVELSDSARSWLRRYTPVDVEGCPFLRGARMALTLRAFERGYQSTLWLVHCLRSADRPSTPLVELRPQCAPVSGRLPRPLPCTASFCNPPFVIISGVEYVNAEELAEGRGRKKCAHLGVDREAADDEGGDQTPDAPLARMSPGDRTMTERGVGISAEAAQRLYGTGPATVGAYGGREGNSWPEDDLGGDCYEDCGVRIDDSRGGEARRGGRGFGGMPDLL